MHQPHPNFKACCGMDASVSACTAAGHCLTLSQPPAARYIHFPGSVNAASLVEDKRRSAKQARLAHARELGAHVSRPKGWQGPAAAGSGSGSGLAPGGCAETSSSEEAGGVEPMESCETRQPGGEGPDEEHPNAAQPMQAEAPGSDQCALHEGAD